MTTIFVNLDASGNNDGTSWNNAYNNLQTAIANAQTGDEIWVAKGTYRPTLETDRTISFVLKNGVKMYGGFAGSETNINQRDITNNVTELSGDLGTQGNNTDNSYHVVDISNTTSSSVLNGFTITGGNADSFSSNRNSGGGIYGYQSSAVLANLVVANNSANFGGGIYLGDGQNQLTNISLIDNYARDNGGGLYNNSTSPIINNVTFGGNIAADDGGAIYNYRDSSPKITEVNFLNNTADRGGAIYNGFSSTSVIDRAIFKDNIAVVAGGGIYNGDRASTTANSLFVGNISPYGAGVYNNSTNSRVINSTFVANQGRFGAAITNRGNETPSIVNSIIWNNESFSSNSIVNIDSANTIISNSIIEDGYNGSSIYTNDPQFVDADNLDYRLAGNSVALDAGSTNEDTDYDLDLAGNARIVGSAIDLGAYEGAAVSPVPVIPTIMQQQVIYVDADATGAKSGTSWSNAYTDLKQAIASAPFGSQIWVAEGIYKPSQSDRDVSFELENGVAVYGGFAGNETQLNQRDIANNITVLSGDIGTTQDSSDNSYHVVDASNTSNATILDGFTIEDGYADVFSNNNNDGGGIYAFGSQAVFANLIIQDNYASDDGGGIYTRDGLNQFINVSFVDNSARYNGGGLFSDSTSILRHIVFNNNTANNGGAIYNDKNLIVEAGAFVNNIAQNNGGSIVTGFSASLNLTDTVFRFNQATTAGGAIYNYDTDSDSTIVNSIFNANTSKFGGAIYNRNSNAVGTNLTFANNQAESGAAVYSTGNSSDKPTYRNSIFWNNKGTVDSAPIVNNTANTVVRNSIVEGGYDGLEIIDLNPKFANLESDDFRLQSDSPAINAGLNDFVVEPTDIIGNDRIVNNRVDLGAYEYFAEQDLSFHPGTIGDSNILVSEVPNTANNSTNPTVHRFFRADTGSHFYTASEVERQAIIDNLPHYSYEGASYQAAVNSEVEDPLSGAKPVYRFFNQSTGVHLYTISEVERDYIIDNLSNYTFENVAYHAYDTPQEDTVELYRFYQTLGDFHFFTPSVGERDYVVDNLPHYQLEGNGGVAFYVHPVE